MPPSRRVLVTGSAGRLGRAAVKELVARGHFVRGFDKVATQGAGESMIGDIVDPAAVARAVEGIETVIHLAAVPDDDDFLTQLLPNNIVAVYHLMEAMRAAGVKRTVLASSGQVMWHRRTEGPWPVRVDDPTQPRWWYAAAKLFLEAAGQIHHNAHGLQVIAVRLGWCPRSPEQVEEIRRTEWAQDVYLSPGDAGRFFAGCVESNEPIGYQVLYATSRPAKLLRYELDPSRRWVGYEPLDTWPTGSER